MKLSLCLLALLVTFASCETAFRPFGSYPTLPDGPHKDVSDFFEGLFSHFDLDKPYQIIYECFCDKSAAVYLEILRTWNQVLVDVNARDAVHVHLDFAKELALSIADHSSSGCIVATQDLSDLLEALGVKRDPILSQISGWLYYQAYFPKFLEEYKPVIQNLDSKDFKAAGAAYGDIMKDNVDAIKNDGVHYLSKVGVANGLSLGLDIDLPKDSLTVWNDTTAAYELEFVYEAAKAVAEGHWWESYDSLIKFWQEKGKDIFDKIPSSIWECLQGSDDNKKVTEKLGIDILSKEFMELQGAWIKKHPLKYHHYSKLVVKNFEGLHFLHVGALKAHLVKTIAKSK